MKNNDTSTIKVVVADNSVIIRNGIVTVISHLPGIVATTYNVKTQESLRNYVFMQDPDIVIVNPLFDGLFDIKGFKEENKKSRTKYIALRSTVLDENTLAEYDENFSIFDTSEVIAEKLQNVLERKEQKVEEPQETLSFREKEIVVCIVKGLTNKEIAEELCLSIHTVITHRRNISHKLQIHSPAGLTIYAIVNKLIDIKDIKNM